LELLFLLVWLLMTHKKIKDMYFDGGDSEVMAKKSIMGAFFFKIRWIFWR